MGLDGFEHSPAAKAIFEEADTLLGFPLSNLCFYGPEDYTYRYYKSATCIIYNKHRILACNVRKGLVTTRLYGRP